MKATIVALVVSIAATLARAGESRDMPPLPERERAFMVVATAHGEQAIELLPVDFYELSDASLGLAAGGIEPKHLLTASGARFADCRTYHPFVEDRGWGPVQLWRCVWRVKGDYGTTYREPQ